MESVDVIDYDNFTDRLKTWIGVAIGFATILAALIGYLQVEAASRDDQANRDSKRFAIQAMSTEIRGETRVAYDYSELYKTWKEYDVLAKDADLKNDKVAAERYRGLRDQLKTLSPILKDPYFEAATGKLKLEKYEADMYVVEDALLTEQFNIASEIKEHWDSKANTYIVHLTLLALSLFLFGLATTLSQRMQLPLAIGGATVSVVTMVWVGLVYFRAPPTLPLSAIESYARGVGLAHQRQYDKAVEEYNAALKIKADYKNALFKRGNAYQNLRQYEAAVADYERAQALGLKADYASDDMGRSYYLLGRFPEAIKAYQGGLELNRQNSSLHFDLALAYLANGQLSVAQKEYQAALDSATKQVAEARTKGKEPPTSLWLAIEEAAEDVEGLVFLMQGETHAWSLATPPPSSKFVKTDETKKFAKEMFATLKNYSVSLEYEGKPPANDLKAKLSNPRFTQTQFDKDGKPTEAVAGTKFIYGTKEVVLNYDYTAMQDGQEVIYEVFVDGVEDPSLRERKKWSGGAQGTAKQPLSFTYSSVHALDPGEYIVEVYVNSQYALSGSFVIEKK